MGTEIATDEHFTWVGRRSLVYSNGPVEITFPLDCADRGLEVLVFFYDPHINDDLSRRYFEENQEKLKDSIITSMKSHGLIPELATESIIGKYKIDQPGVFSAIGSFLRRCMQEFRKK